MRHAARRNGFALTVALLYSVLAAHAHAAEPLRWDAGWSRFRPSEYVLTGVAGAASLALYFGVKSASEPRWTGGILFDDVVRDSVRLRQRDDLIAARFASDLTALSAITWVVGVDSLAVPSLRKHPELASQLVLMDAEAFAISTLVTNSMFKVVARARPSYVACQRDSHFDSLCHLNDTSSFPSGHANTTFTAAGLSCAHHLHLALYGDRLADVLACSGSIALAGVTSGLRVLGDRHYTSDVLAGALIGFAVGYGVPTLLHYRTTSGSSPAAQAAQPLGASMPVGPSFSGTF